MLLEGNMENLNGLTWTLVNMQVALAVCTVVDIIDISKNIEIL